MNSGSVVMLKTGPQRVAEALKTLDYIYVIEYRRDADIAGQGKRVASVLAELEDIGLVLEAKEEEESLFVLFATAIDPEVIPVLVEVEEEQIRELVSDDLARAEEESEEELVTGEAVPEEGDEGVEVEASGSKGGRGGVATGSGSVVVLRWHP